MTLPGADVVTCASCSRPVALAHVRAFPSHENEHGEPTYVLSCALCVVEHYVMPMEAELRSLAPELIPAVLDEAFAATATVDRERAFALAQQLADKAGIPLVDPLATWSQPA